MNPFKENPLGLLPQEFQGDQKDILGRTLYGIQHVLCFPFQRSGDTASVHPYPMTTETFGQFSDNIKGTGAYRLLRVLCVLFADPRIGCPSLSLPETTKEATMVATVLSKRMSLDGPSITHTPLHDKLKEFLSSGNTFSRLDALRIQWCLKNNNQLGYICLMSEANARREIKRIACTMATKKTKRPRVNQGTEEEADEAEEEEGDAAGSNIDMDKMHNCCWKLWNEGFGGMLRELERQDGRDWANSGDEAALREVMAEEEASMAPDRHREAATEYGRELMDSLILGDDPEEVLSSRSFDEGLFIEFLMSMDRGEREDSLQALGNGPLAAVFVDKVRMRPSAPVPLGIPLGARRSRFQMEEEGRGDPGREFDTRDSLLSTRRTSPDNPDLQPKVEVFVQRVVNRVGMEGDDSGFMLVALVRDPFWSAEAGAEAMIDFASRLKDARLANQAGHKPKQLYEYRLVMASESQRVKIEAAKRGSFKQEDVKHPVLAMTKSSWQDMLFYLAYGPETLATLIKSRKKALGATGNPWNLADLATVERAFDVMPPSAKNTSTDWEIDGRSTVIVPSMDVWCLPLKHREVFDQEGFYAMNHMYFPWVKPSVPSVDPDTHRYVRVPLAQAKKRDESVHSTLQSVALATGLDLDDPEQREMAEIILNSVNGDGGDGRIPERAREYLALNGNPVLGVRAIAEPVQEAFKMSLAFSAIGNEPDGTPIWRDPAGFPWEASPEYCADVLTAQRDILKVYHQMVTEDTLPTTMKPIRKWVAEHSDECGVPFRSPKLLYQTDNEIPFGYSQALMESSEVFKAVLGLEGDPVNWFTIQTAIDMGHHHGEGMRMHIFLLGDPSGGKSKAMELILKYLSIEGTWTAQDSQSTQAGTSGIASWGPIFADEAPPGMTQKGQGTTSESQTKMRAWKQILSAGWVARKVCEYIVDPAGNKVRSERIYFTSIMCPHILISNHPLLYGPLLDRFVKLGLAISENRMIGIMEKAAQNTDPSTSAVTSIDKRQNQWNAVYTAEMLWLMTARVVQEPVKFVAAQLGMKMMKWMRGVAPTVRMHARMMDLFKKLSTREVVRKILCAFRSPGSPWYMKPPTHENLVHAASLLNYVGAEEVFAMWPIVCRQIVRPDDQAIAGALRTMYLGNFTAQQAKNASSSGLAMHLMYGEGISGPVVSVPPGYHCRKVEKDNSPAPPPQSTTPALPPPLPQQDPPSPPQPQPPLGGRGSFRRSSASTVSTRTPNGHQSHRQKTTQTYIYDFVGQTTGTSLVDYGYVDTGRTIGELAEDIRSAMAKKHRIPKASVQAYLRQLIEVRVEMVDCRLTENAFRDLHDAYIKNPPNDIEAWLARRIDGYGPHRSAALAIETGKEKRTVAISTSVFATSDDNYILDVLWKCVHKGMRNPEKIVVAMDSGASSFSTFTFHKEKFDKIAEVTEWMIPRSGVSMSKGSARSIGATTRTMESFMAEGMDARQATAAMLKEVRANVTSSKFASVTQRPMPLTSPTGMYMDLTEMAARMCWNLHGCQSWTDANGVVRREPLTPALMNQNYVDYMGASEDLDVGKMDLQQPYATTAALEEYCNQANRGTMDEEQLKKIQPTMPWLQSTTATTTVASATDCVNEGTSLDDVIAHMQSRMALPPPPRRQAIEDTLPGVSSPPPNRLAIGGSSSSVPVIPRRPRKKKTSGKNGETTSTKRPRRKKGTTSKKKGPSDKAPKKKNKTRTVLGRGKMSKEAMIGLLATDEPSSD